MQEGSTKQFWRKKGGEQLQWSSKRGAHNLICARAGLSHKHHHVSLNVSKGDLLEVSDEAVVLNIVCLGKSTGGIFNEDLHLLF